VFFAPLPGSNVQAGVQENTEPSAEAAPDLGKKGIIAPNTIADGICGYLQLFQMDGQTPSGATQLLGVEFVKGEYWVTSGNISVADTTNVLFRFNSDGLLTATYPQSSAEGWGWRDLAYDGRYLYASDSNVLVQIDTANGLATGATVPCPENPCRALAYDPQTDHFWTANFSGPIYEFDRAGTVINTFPNPGLAIYGMGWDTHSNGGPFLWSWSQDGAGTNYTLATQFDPATGTPTGVSFAGSDLGLNNLAGGMTIINGDHPRYRNKLIFVGLHQADLDTIVGYDMCKKVFYWPMVTPPALGVGR
jgi:hypothetical protein